MFSPLLCSPFPPLRKERGSPDEGRTGVRTNATRNQNLIILKDIFYQYPQSDFEITIDNLNFEAGKKYALIGPSGFGNTTLLNLVAGILLQAGEPNELGFGCCSPLFCGFEARGFPIVGKNLDYFEFKGMNIAAGRNLSYIGKCVIGATVAEELEIGPGDSLTSLPEKFFDLAWVYPLKMTVAGVLAQTDSPDDRGTFYQ